MKIKTQNKGTINEYFPPTDWCQMPYTERFLCIFEKRDIRKGLIDGSWDLKVTWSTTLFNWSRSDQLIDDLLNVTTWDAMPFLKRELRWLRFEFDSKFKTRKLLEWNSICLQEIYFQKYPPASLLLSFLSSTDDCNPGFFFFSQSIFFKKFFFCSANWIHTVSICCDVVTIVYFSLGLIPFTPSSTLPCLPCLFLS